MSQPDKTEEELKPLSAEVIRVLVDNHRRFKTFLEKRVASKADAEEILQQCLSRAVEKTPLAENEPGVLAWFFQVLRNALIDHYRAKETHQNKLEEFSSAHSSLQQEITNEVCECLKGLLPTLKEEYAEVLRSVDLNEESPEQVASRMGITRNSLDVRLHRARQALKKSLVRSCGTCTEHGCLNCTCQ